MKFKHQFAIIVAIDAYQNGLPVLKTPVNDARAIADTLKQQHGYETCLILNQQASKATLLKTLKQELSKRVSKNDCLIFYFAGHGIALNGEDGPEGYLIPQDGKLGDVRSYLAMSDVHNALHQLECRHFLGILDCCFAGSFRWSSTRDISFNEPGVLHQERFNRFIRDPAWQVITSAASDQTALDAFSLRSQGEGIQSCRHSPFATALIEALMGKADIYPAASNGKPAGDGVITATELYLYLRDRVEISTEKQAIRQTPGIHPLKKHDKGEYIFFTPGHQLNLPPAPLLDISQNPYQGLQAFEEKHNALFFGRDKLKRQLRDFVTTHPFTVVIGASGSGKSSLVSAGLVPQLREEKKRGKNAWCILSPIRPGEDPFAALTSALNQANLPSVDLRSSRKTLAHSVAKWAKKNPSAQLLICIDQSEELITLCNCEEERRLFFQQILTAISAHAEKLRVVLTLRADFEPQIREAGIQFMAQVPNYMNQVVLADRWQQGRFILPAMTRGELQDAIEKPAEARVMHFQPHTLVDRLIDEVANMPGALPLLSFALSELYLSYLQRQRKANINGTFIDRALTGTDYNKLGGVIQSLTQRANREYQALLSQNLAYATTVRNVMLRMVVAGTDLARRKVPETELVYLEPENSRVKQVINQFLSARLLVSNTDRQGRTYYEPAHDALVKGWDKLLTWQKANEEQISLQRRLTHSATEWKNCLEQKSKSLAKNRARKPAQFLWNTNPYLDVLSSRLKTDSNWFNQVEKTFVQQSLQQRHQNASWRWRLAGIVALVITTTAVVASIQWVSAQRRLVSTINALTAASQELFDANKEFEALLTSLKAGRQAQQAAFGFTPEMKYEIKNQLQQAAHSVKERNRLEGHKAQVYSVSFNPNGRLLASASVDNTIRLWDVETGRCVREINGHSDSVNFVTFSPSGQLLASASAVENRIHLWNVETGQKIASFSKYLSDSNGTNGISFSPSGEVLAAASEGNVIKLYDISTQKEIGSLAGHEGRVNGVSFSPNGRYLASASSDKTVRLWEVATQQEVVTLKGHSEPVFTVHFSPNGRLAASASEDDSIRFWDIATHQQTALLKGHKERPTTLSFSPDGQHLASTGFDSRIKLWDVEQRVEIATLTGHQGHITGLSFHPAKQLLASASADNTIKLWELSNDDEINLLAEHPGIIRTTQFSPSGHLLAWATDGSDDNTIKLWNTQKLEEVGTLVGHTSGVQSVNFSPSEQQLASASWDGTVRLWDLTEPFESIVLEADNDWVNDVEFSPSGRLLASSGEDTTVKLWDVETQEMIATLEGHLAPVRGVSFDPSGQLLASASWDKTIRLWDIEKQTNIATLKGHIAGIASVNFSPDGKLLASASDDTTVKLWDVSRRQAIATLRGHSNQVSTAEFSPSGQLLASASKDRSIKIWDTETYQETNVLRNHKAAVNSVDFSLEDGLLVSGSESGQVVLWNLDALENASFETLLEQSCDWMQGYLENNNSVSKNDRLLCENAGETSSLE